MQFPNSMFLLGALMGLASAAPQVLTNYPTATGPVIGPIITASIPTGAPILTLPGSGGQKTCSVLQGRDCFTATTTVTPASCIKKCAPPTNVACPAVIIISTTEVPCADLCCPKTPTKTVTKRCPSCTKGCTIPTTTATVTTGCNTIPTGILTRG